MYEQKKPICKYKQESINGKHENLSNVNEYQKYPSIKNIHLKKKYTRTMKTTLASDIDFESPGFFKFDTQNDHIEEPQKSEQTHAKNSESIKHESNNNTNLAKENIKKPKGLNDVDKRQKSAETSNPTPENALIKKREFREVTKSDSEKRNKNAKEQQQEIIEIEKYVAPGNNAQQVEKIITEEENKDTITTSLQNVQKEDETKQSGQTRKEEIVEEIHKRSIPKVYSKITTKASLKMEIGEVSNKELEGTHKTSNINIGQTSEHENKKLIKHNKLEYLEKSKDLDQHSNKSNESKIKSDTLANQEFEENIEKPVEQYNKEKTDIHHKSKDDKSTKLFEQQYLEKNKDFEIISKDQINNKISNSKPEIKKPGSVSEFKSISTDKNIEKNQSAYNKNKTDSDHVKETKLLGSDFRDVKPRSQLVISERISLEQQEQENLNKSEYIRISQHSKIRIDDKEKNVNTERIVGRNSSINEEVQVHLEKNKDLKSKIRSMDKSETIETISTDEKNESFKTNEGIEKLEKKDKNQIGDEYQPEENAELKKSIDIIEKIDEKEQGTEKYDDLEKKIDTQLLIENTAKDNLEFIPTAAEQELQIKQETDKIYTNLEEKEVEPKKERSRSKSNSLAQVEHTLISKHKSIGDYKNIQQIDNKYSKDEVLTPKAFKEDNNTLNSTTQRDDLESREQTSLNLSEPDQLKGQTIGSANFEERQTKGNHKEDKRETKDSILDDNLEDESTYVSKTGGYTSGDKLSRTTNDLNKINETHRIGKVTPKSHQENNDEKSLKPSKEVSVGKTTSNHKEDKRETRDSILDDNLEHKSTYMSKNVGNICDVECNTTINGLDKTDKTHRIHKVIQNSHEENTDEKSIKPSKETFVGKKTSSHSKQDKRQIKNSILDDNLEDNSTYVSKNGGYSADDECSRTINSLDKINKTHRIRKVIHNSHQQNTDEKPLKPRKETFVGKKTSSHSKEDMRQTNDSILDENLEDEIIYVSKNGGYTSDDEFSRTTNDLDKINETHRIGKVIQKSHQQTNNETSLKPTNEISVGKKTSNHKEDKRETRDSILDDNLKDQSIYVSKNGGHISDDEFSGTTNDLDKISEAHRIDKVIQKSHQENNDEKSLQPSKEIFVGDLDKINETHHIGKVIKKSHQQNNDEKALDPSKEIFVGKTTSDHKEDKRETKDGILDDNLKDQSTYVSKNGGHTSDEFSGTTNDLDKISEAHRIDKVIQKSHEQNNDEKSLKPSKETFIGKTTSNHKEDERETKNSILDDNLEDESSYVSKTGGYTSDDELSRTTNDLDKINKTHRINKVTQKSHQQNNDEKELKPSKEIFVAKTTSNYKEDKRETKDSILDNNLEDEIIYMSKTGGYTSDDELSRTTNDLDKINKTHRIGKEIQKFDQQNANEKSMKPTKDTFVVKKTSNHSKEDKIKKSSGLSTMVETKDSELIITKIQERKRKTDETEKDSFENREDCGLSEDTAYVYSEDMDEKHKINELVKNFKKEALDVDDDEFNILFEKLKKELEIITCACKEKKTVDENEAIQAIQNSDDKSLSVYEDPQICREELIAMLTKVQHLLGENSQRNAINEMVDELKAEIEKNFCKCNSNNRKTNVDLSNNEVMPNMTVIEKFEDSEYTSLAESKYCDIETFPDIKDIEGIITHDKLEAELSKFYDKICTTLDSRICKCKPNKSDIENLQTQLDNIHTEILEKLNIISCACRFPNVNITSEMTAGESFRSIDNPTNISHEEINSKTLYSTKIPSIRLSRDEEKSKSLYLSKIPSISISKDEKKLKSLYSAYIPSISISNDEEKSKSFNLSKTPLRISNGSSISTGEANLSKSSEIEITQTSLTASHSPSSPTTVDKSDKIAQIGVRKKYNSTDNVEKIMVRIKLKDELEKSIASQRNELLELTSENSKNDFDGSSKEYTIKYETIDDDISQLKVLTEDDKIKILIPIGLNEDINYIHDKII